MRRKTGPRDGLTEKLLANSRSLPKPDKPWRQMTALERSRFKDIRALWRRRNQKSKYKRIGAMIRRIREKLEMTPAEFSGKLEVSIITLRRWERGYGYCPRPDLMEQIKKLGKVRNGNTRTI
jgi:DNA-binding transcriptional regulator YiaG